MASSEFITKKINLISQEMRLGHFDEERYEQWVEPLMRFEERVVSDAFEGLKRQEKRPENPLAFLIKSCESIKKGKDVFNFESTIEKRKRLGKANDMDRAINYFGIKEVERYLKFYFKEHLKGFDETKLGASFWFSLMNSKESLEVCKGALSSLFELIPPHVPYVASDR